MRGLEKNRGAFLPLLAMLLFGLLGVIFYLSIKAPHARRVSASLRRAAEDICSRATSEALLSAEMVDIFASEVKNIVENDLIKDVVIREARIYLAVEDDFNYSNVITKHCPADLPPAEQHIQGIDYTKEQFLSDLDANYDCGKYSSEGNENYPVCTMIGFMCGDKFNSMKFPKGILNQHTSGGNTIACELVGEVQAGILSKLFSGDNSQGPDLIEARSVYWRAPAEHDPSYNSSADLEKDKYKGLTLILDPYGKTEASDERFIFGGTDPFWDRKDMYKLYDPLYEGENEFHKVAAFTSSSDYPKKDVPGLVRKSIPAFSVKDPTDINYDRDYKDWQEHLVMCQSPASLFANTFLYAFLSLVKRNFHFSKRLRVLFTNPIYRHRPKTSLSAESYPDALNPATLLSRPLSSGFYETGRKIFPPYIRYFGGVDDQDPLYAVPEEFGKPLGNYDSEASGFATRAQGWSQPFVDCKNSKNPLCSVPENINYLDKRSAELTELNAIVSFQVANCRQLFLNAKASPQSYRELSGVTSVMDFNATNLFFESSLKHTYKDYYGPFSEEDTTWQPYIMPEPWSQNNNPMQAEAVLEVWPNTLAFISSLGIPQQCPLADGTDRFKGVGDECHKPEKDFAGDIVAALAFSAGIDEEGIKSMMSQIVKGSAGDNVDIRFGDTMPIVVSPGLFRIDVDNGTFYTPIKEKIPKINKSAYIFNDDFELRDESNILIFTRRPLTGQQERRLITAISTSELMSKRRIALVYAPLRSDAPEDILQEELDWYRALVGDPKDGTYKASLVGKRSVYILGPYSRDNRDPDTLELIHYQGLSDSEAYKTYWKNQLTKEENKPSDTPSGNIVAAARAIWSSFFTVQQRLF